MLISSAIHAKLAAAGTVTASLASFKASPAIFTTAPVPLSCARPYIVTAGNVSDVPFDNISGEQGRDFMRDVWVVDDAANGNAVDVIAEAVRATLHNQTMTISGARHVLTRCVGAHIAPTDATLTGRILTFRILAMEN